MKDIIQLLQNKIEQFPDIRIALTKNPGRVDNSPPQFKPSATCISKKPNHILIMQRGLIGYGFESYKTIAT